MYFKQDTVKKPKTKDVSLPQWIGANARIMTAMIKEGSLTGNELLGYLEYTTRIGDLASMHTISSVMLYDH